MPLFKKLNQSEFIELAYLKGWASGKPEIKIETLPKVSFYSMGKRDSHPSVEVRTASSILVTLPEVVIQGSSFGLIYEDKIIPGGLAHSPVWMSSEFIDAGNGFYQYTVKKLVAIDDTNPCLLGFICHWGHFFIDALDRLLKYQELNLLDRLMLVADPDFLDLHPQVDATFAVPQVTQLMRLLGIRLDPSRVFPVLKTHDYVVSNMVTCTLEAQKPAISSGNFVKLRERVLGHVDRIDDDKKSLVFVGRSEVTKRLILNQDTLCRYLEQAKGCRVIFPEHLSLDEAINIFSSASRVILPVGSAKFNLIFCRPGTKVICITPMGYTSSKSGLVMMIRHMCHALGLILAFYECEIERAPILLNSNLLISKSDIRRILAEFDDLS